MTLLRVRRELQHFGEVKKKNVLQFTCWTFAPDKKGSPPVKCKRILLSCEHRHQKIHKNILFEK